MGFDFGALKKELSQPAAKEVTLWSSLCKKMLRQFWGTLLSYLPLLLIWASAAALLLLLPPRWDEENEKTLSCLIKTNYLPFRHGVCSAVAAENVEN